MSRQEWEDNPEAVPPESENKTQPTSPYVRPGTQVHTLSPDQKLMTVYIAKGYAVTHHAQDGSKDTFHGGTAYLLEEKAGGFVYVYPDPTSCSEDTDEKTPVAIVHTEYEVNEKTMVELVVFYSDSNVRLQLLHRYIS